MASRQIPRGNNAQKNAAKRGDLKEAIRKLIEEGEEDRGENPMNGKQLKKIQTSKV